MPRSGKAGLDLKRRDIQEVFVDIRSEYFFLNFDCHDVYFIVIICVLL